jgi:hypothetical protein
MSIVDETQTYSWKSISDKFPTTNRIEIECKDFLYLTLKEYFIISEESMNKLSLKVKVSLPRGVEFKIPKNSRRNCLEVRYE